MTDIGLDRADHQGLFAFRAKHRSQSLDFNWIAKGRARAMRFHIADLLRGDSSTFERGANDCFLRRPVRGCQTVAAPILVDGGTANQGQDVIAICQGV